MFYDDLCALLSSIKSVCEDDILILLGEFNARVGTATSEFERSQELEGFMVLVKLMMRAHHY